MVFLHHHKAGGGTIKSLLLAAAEAKQLQIAAAFSDSAYMLARSNAWRRRGGADIVVGAYTADACELVAATSAVKDEDVPSRSCSTFTMLREPRERVASSYLYCKVRTWSYCPRPRRRRRAYHYHYPYPCLCLCLRPHRSDLSPQTFYCSVIGWTTCATTLHSTRARRRSRSGPNT